MPAVSCLLRSINPAIARAALLPLRIERHRGLIHRSRHSMIRRPTNAPIASPIKQMAESGIAAMVRATSSKVTIEMATTLRTTRVVKNENFLSLGNILQNLFFL